MTPDMDSSHVPTHVPQERVYDFDFFAAPRGCESPQRELAERLHREAPAIFYTPRNGGHWVVTRQRHAFEIYRQPENFSSDPRFNAGKAMEPRFNPLQYDPPEQVAMRGVLLRYFSPVEVRKGEAAIRGLAASLIDTLHPKGACEFVADVARIFPVTVFLKMADAPPSDRDWLMRTAEHYLRGGTFQERSQGRAAIGGFLSDLLRSRAGGSGADLISLVANARLPDRELTEAEKLGMATLTFFAGLDTTGATLGFIMHFLARSPEIHARLAAEPALIDRGLNELLRLHGVVINERGVAHDLDYEGVAFRTGDRVMLMTPLMGFDDHAVEDPYRVDLDRSDSRHFAFGGGTHRCLGSHLAQLEIRIFLEEWVRRIGRCEVAEARFTGGLAWTPEVLRMTWDTVS